MGRIATHDLSYVPDLRPGRRVSARRENTIKRAVEALQKVTTSGGVGLHVDHDGVLHRARLLGAHVCRFRYKNMNWDFLECRTWDGNTEGTEPISIAKPWNLRASVFDGQVHDGIYYSYSTATKRTANADDFEETQIVIPRYVYDDEIYAIMNPTGGSGVFSYGMELQWLDLNLAGRAWAMTIYDYD